MIRDRRTTRILVDFVTGDIQVPSAIRVLAAQALQHSSDGNCCLDPEGRDFLLRRIASTGFQHDLQITMLSAMKGFPIRIGIRLISHLAFSSSVNDAVRLECFDILVNSLSDDELDKILQKMDGQPAKIQILLSESAIIRNRSVPERWLLQSFQISDEVEYCIWRFIVAFDIWGKGTQVFLEAEKVLVDFVHRALVGDRPEDQRVLDTIDLVFITINSGVDKKFEWIDLDVCYNAFLDFFAVNKIRRYNPKNPDITNKAYKCLARARIASYLLGHLPTQRSAKMLYYILRDCYAQFERLNGEDDFPLYEAAKSVASSLSRIDPRSLLSFPANWAPVDESLRNKSMHKGWLVFPDRILDNRGQKILAPWETADSHVNQVDGFEESNLKKTGVIPIAELKVGKGTHGEGAEPKGILRIGNIFDHLSHLKTYYLIGCAFHDMPRSLNKVSILFKKIRDGEIDGKKLPPDVPDSAPSLSGIIKILKIKVFKLYYRKPDIQLLYQSKKGLDAVMTEDGWRAWEETRDFLQAYKQLPDW